jgi:hypothetical protein
LPVKGDWLENGTTFDLDDAEAVKLCKAIGCVELVNKPNANGGKRGPGRPKNKT